MKPGDDVEGVAACKSGPQSVAQGFLRRYKQFPALKGPFIGNHRIGFLFVLDTWCPTAGFNNLFEGPGRIKNSWRLVGIILPESRGKTPSWCRLRPPKNQIQKTTVWTSLFFDSPGMFRNLREDRRIHVHLSWNLSGFMVPSQGLTSSWEIVCFPCTGHLRVSALRLLFERLNV